MQQLIRKDKSVEKSCPYCNTLLNKETMKYRDGIFCVIYDCPQGCKLTYQEGYCWVHDDTNTFIYYEEDMKNV